MFQSVAHLHFNRLGVRVGTWEVSPLCATLSNNVSDLTGSKAVNAASFPLFSREEFVKPFDVSFSEEIWCLPFKILKYIVIVYIFYILF